MRIGSLFSGYGGLDLGVQSVVGGQVAWHADIDPGACRILEHRFPGVPNLDDVSAVDWSAVEPVDVLTGGFPCQDVSAAGKRAGLAAGTRSGLWAEFARGIDQLHPSLVVIENVRGLLSATAEHPAHSDLEPCSWCLGDDEPVTLRALGAVLGDLADLGYDAAWHGLRAADVGAPHGRFRVFVVAWPAADTDHAGRGEHGRPVAVRPEQSAAERRGRGTAADAQGHGRHQGWPEPARIVGGSDAALGGDAAADAHGGQHPGRQQDPQRSPVQRVSASGTGGGALDWGPFAPAVRRWERLTRPAPAPTERGKNGQPRLSPAFVEWMMGLPAGWVTDVPGINRNGALKALGNGVVPQQAAAALRILLTPTEKDAAA